MSTYSVPGQYERSQAARLVVKEARVRFDAELQSLIKLAENEGYSGFAILYLGPDLRSPVDVSQLHGRVWIGSYADEKLDSTLFLGTNDPRCEPVHRAYGALLRAQSDCKRASPPILPMGWRGSSPDDVESLRQLRNYLRYVLSCSRATTSQAHKLYPLADVLFNVDKALVDWEVVGCPEVSREPTSDDDAYRKLLRKLQWLNSVVEQSCEKPTAEPDGPSQPNFVRLNGKLVPIGDSPYNRDWRVLKAFWPKQNGEIVLFDSLIGPDSVVNRLEPTDGAVTTAISEFNKKHSVIVGWKVRTSTTRRTAWKEPLE